MKYIALSGKNSHGKHAIVDDDLELPSGKWSFTTSGYAMKRINGKCRTMQSWIMQTPKGMETDHINENKLDNRRENLRICTRGFNNQRKQIDRANSSGFKGVQWYKQTNRWRAEIMFNKKSIHLGYYMDIEPAIKAYNQKAIELFGEQAFQNSLPAR